MSFWPSFWEQSLWEECILNGGNIRKNIYETKKLYSGRMKIIYFPKQYNFRPKAGKICANFLNLFQLKERRIQAFYYLECHAVLD